MFRYVGLVWDTRSESQNTIARILGNRVRELSPQWRSVFDSNGLQVLCAGIQESGSRPCLLHDRAGVVLGTLYDRTGTCDERPSRRLTLDASESFRIIRSAGRDLIDRFWGRYVALVLCPRTNMTWVIRDPTAGLPCFAVRSSGVLIVFSCVSDLLKLGAISFSIDWRYVASRAVAGPKQTAGTALSEVMEFHGGECATILRDGISRSFYWHPFSIAKAARIEEPTQAAAELRSAVKTCINAWASDHRTLIHRLSGGFDSSVVLGCLAMTPTLPRMICLTYHVPGGFSDQRHWARIAAGRAACEHVEHARAANAGYFSDLLNASISTNPLTDIVFLETSRIERCLADRANATAIFDGSGGDSLFGRHSRRVATTDYIDLHGIEWHLSRIAVDAAVLLDTSIWKIAAGAIRHRFLKKPWGLAGELIRYRSLVNLEIRSDMARENRFSHPWFAHIDDIPRGTVELALSIAMGRSFYDPLSSPEAACPEPVSPLLSQPIMELCLRIPSYLHVMGGRDRALARSAFSNDIPREIINRHWKDRSPRFAEECLIKNVAFVRGYLLDGILVKERLLDKGRLEAALSAVPARSAGFVGEIFDHLLVETWLKSWNSAIG